MALPPGGPPATRISSESLSLDAVLNVRQRELHVPAYQRPYMWDVEQVHRVLADLTRAKMHADAYYLMGTVVLLQQNPAANGHPEQLEIIDGQQRLTTLVMVYAALCHLLREASRAIAAKAEAEAEAEVKQEERQSVLKELRKR